jgi:hypothetical protein
MTMSRDELVKGATIKVAQGAKKRGRAGDQDLSTVTKCDTSCIDTIYDKGTYPKWVWS